MSVRSPSTTRLPEDDAIAPIAVDVPAAVLDLSTAAASVANGSADDAPFAHGSVAHGSVANGIAGSDIAAESPIGAVEGASLLTLLLGEQQSLSAVEAFARDHDAGTVPLQARYYSKLLPAAPPGPGQQYAFDVDLDRCSGCKACVTACRSLNGLDPDETWRDVGLLVGGTAANPVLQHVTTACHHCLEPACAIACPVDAYEKDPVTGIVRHLDDQCFGCRYCTLACPYDVPRYHAGKGIVRKCDMCSQRLAVGEAPACVQACPHEAIAIRTVDVAQVRADAEASHFLPAAPDPALTLPTTVYRTRRILPRNTLPADYHAVASGHSHGPLVAMLVLTQLSVGAFVVGLLLDGRLPPDRLASFLPLHATLALACGLLALAASTLHLGRPQYAFRAVIGLRHSWLSREIVAFGLFAVLAGAYAAACSLPRISTAWREAVGWGVALSGLVGIGCSAMIYAATGREFWSPGRTLLKFLATAAVLGPAATWLTVVAFGDGSPARGDESSAGPGGWLGRCVLLAGAAKLLLDAETFLHLAARRTTPLKRSARLMLGELSNVTLARFACGVLGSIVLPGVLLATDVARGTRLVDVVAVALLFAGCLAGELLERRLFFAAESGPRMPGGVPS